MKRHDELWLADDPANEGSLETMPGIDERPEPRDGELGLKWALGDVWPKKKPPARTRSGRAA